MPEDLRFLRFYHSIFEFVIGALAYAINLALIYAAVYKSPKQLKAYSAIIILNSSVDIVFNTINIVVQLVVEMKNGGLFMMSGYFLEHVPQPYASYMHNFWAFGLKLAVINVPVQFIYRYMIVVRNRTLTGLELVGVFAIPALLSAVDTVFSATVVFKVTEEERRQLLPTLQNDSLWLHDVPVFSHSDLKGGLLQVEFEVCVAIVAASYIVIFYTGYQIYAKLKASEANMSRVTRSAQRQLTKILLIESIIPLTTCVPLIYCISAVTFGITIPLVGLIIATMASTIPLINAICIICIVPSYRRFFSRFLPRLLRSAIVTEMTAGSSTHQPTLSKLSQTKVFWVEQTSNQQTVT